MHGILAFVQRLVGTRASEPAGPRAMPAMKIEVGSHKMCLSGATSHEQAVTLIEEHYDGLGRTTVRGLSLPLRGW
jgi:hypothetical protein